MPSQPQRFDATVVSSLSSHKFFQTFIYSTCSNSSCFIGLFHHSLLLPAAVISSTQIAALLAVFEGSMELVQISSLSPFRIWVIYPRPHRTVALLLLTLSLFVSLCLSCHVFLNWKLLSHHSFSAFTYHLSCAIFLFSMSYTLKTSPWGTSHNIQPSGALHLELLAPEICHPQ